MLGGGIFEGGEGSSGHPDIETGRRCRVVYANHFTLDVCLRCIGTPIIIDKNLSFLIDKNFNRVFRMGTWKFFVRCIAARRT